MADRYIELVQDIRIGAEYQLVELLGQGTFGKVYLGRHVSTLKEVAIKLEHYSVQPPMLQEEARAYKSLGDHDGFPRIHWHGGQDDYECLVMDLMGPNLEDLLQYCGGCFSLKTTLLLTCQILRRFESLHAANYLYRDVKPENFLMGTGQNGDIVHMTDLGMVTRHYPEFESPTDAKTAQKLQLLGTCRFASVQGHVGRGLSLRDDLEALGYMLVYFMKGKLPWQGLRSKSGHDKYRMVFELKRMITAEDLCAGLPSVFVTYFNYVASLQFGELPDYDYLQQIFGDAILQHGFIDDKVFDWTVVEYMQFRDRESIATPKKDAKAVKGPKKNATARRRVAPNTSS